MPAKSRITLQTASTGARITREVQTLFGAKPFQRTAPAGFFGFLAAMIFARFAQFDAKTSRETMRSYLPSSPGASSKLASHSAKVWSVSAPGSRRR